MINCVYMEAEPDHVENGEIVIAMVKDEYSNICQQSSGIYCKMLVHNAAVIN